MEFFDNEQETEQDSVVDFEKKTGKRPFAIWKVNGREYKLKLSTTRIVELEKKYKTNLMNIMGADKGGMPALAVMLDVAHAAMRDYTHGVKESDMAMLFDKYLEENDSSQLNFYTEIYMNIFAVSGFFSTSLTEKVQETLEEVKESL